MIGEICAGPSAPEMPAQVDAEALLDLVDAGAGKAGRPAIGPG
jgi:hypothetical protein